MSQAMIKVDFNQIVGKIKPLHAVNDVPSATFNFGGAEEGIAYFVEAGIPYCRRQGLGTW